MICGTKFSDNVMAFKSECGYGVRNSLPNVKYAGEKLVLPHLAVFEENLMAGNFELQSL